MTTAVKKLILLVGSNPFPNYIAALAFKPESIFFICTEETVEIKQRLQKVLEKKLSGALSNCKACILDNAVEPHKIFSKLQSECDEVFSNANAHLHYTGGTKAIAAQCLHYFYKKHPDPESSASYLDDDAGCIHHDAGFSTDLKECNITISLDDLLEIHGLQKNSANLVVDDTHMSDSAKVMKVPEWIDELANKAFKNPIVAHTFYDICEEFEKARKAGKMPEELNFSQIVDLKGASVPLRIPIKNKDGRKNELEFWGGIWLEVWMANLLKQRYGSRFDAIYQSVNCTSPDSKNYKTEIDLCLIKGYRFYAISMTVDGQYNSICKSKLFEITIRGRQLGGDHARTALCCFVDGVVKDTGVKKVDVLEDCMRSSFSTKLQPYVFGLEDLRNWAGIDSEGNPVTPDFSKLENFLELD